MSVNNQTIYQMTIPVNDIMKQATGRDDVQDVSTEYVSVAQVFQPTIPEIRVGEFSQYAKRLVQFPNAVNGNGLRDGAIIDLPFIPKAMVFYGGTPVIGNIISGSGIFNYDGKLDNVDETQCGGISVFLGNAGNNRFSYLSYPVYAIDSTSSGGYSRVVILDMTMYITNYGGNTHWSSTDTYTFEFYA